MSTPLDFKGRRRDLAIVFREKRTAREAARELGVETGSVYGLIQRMHGERILRADSDPAPPTRGTQYWLSEGAQIALNEALEEAQGELADPGRLHNDQRVLLASGPGVMAVQQVFADIRVSAVISWAAWLGDAWLLAMDPASDFLASKKLAAALERVGYECQIARVDGLQAGKFLREQASLELERVAV